MFTDKIKTEVYKFLNKVFIKGYEAQGVHSGTTANRPTVTLIGYEYFDTTLGSVVWWNGSSWVGLGTIPTILSASATLDFGDILAGESATLTATVTGAALLDNVNVSGPASIYSANATIDEWVSSTDTVSVRVRNFGGTTINPTSGTFNIKVFK